MWKEVFQLLGHLLFQQHCANLFSPSMHIITLSRKYINNLILEHYCLLLRIVANNAFQCV